MLLSPVEMALSFTNITGFTSCTSELINSIGLMRFRLNVKDLDTAESSTKF